MAKRTKILLLGTAGAAALAVALSACGSAGTGVPNNSGGGSSGNSAQSGGSGNSGGGNGGQTTTSTSSSSNSNSSSSNSNSSSTNTNSSNLPSAGDFELDLPFTSFNSSNAVTEAEEENAFQHVLFYIDPSGASQSQVIDGNLSGSPVPATVTPHSDGSVSVDYSEQTSSATIDFKGTLTGKTMSATVEVNQIGGDVVEGTEYIGAGNGTVTFTTPINPATYSEIPQPPTGRGCGYTSDYGVDLTWNPPSGGASAYDVYAVINTSTTDVVYEGQVSSAGMVDESELAKANDGGTMSYEIYSASSSGLESLTPLYVTLTGLPGATAPICSYSG
jgi:hypothetical protein